MEGLFENGNKIASSTVPTIDMQNFPGEYKKLREATEKWGCFRIINHGIELTLMSEMHKVVKSLQDLPLEIKKRNVSDFAGSGYFRPTETSPYTESLGFYDMNSSAAVQTTCSQLNVSPEERGTIEAYTKAACKLSIDIARKIAASMGVGNNLCFEEWPCELRINKYNFTREAVGSTALKTHTDSGFLTILHDDEKVGGLELIDNSGSFVAIDPLPGSLLINLGDLATVWSNGRLHNVKHRVQCKEAKIRYSIACFLLGPREASVEAPAELVSPENPRLYIPFIFEEYRKLRLSTKLSSGEALQLLRASDSMLNVKAATM